jgi:nitroreductase
VAVEESGDLLASAAEPVGEQGRQAGPGGEFVVDAELTDIWELAKWAPTSANSQPLRVLYVRRGQARDCPVRSTDCVGE